MGIDGYKVALVIVRIVLGLALSVSAFASVNALCVVIERKNRKNDE